MAKGSAVPAWIDQEPQFSDDLTDNNFDFRWRRREHRDVSGLACLAVTSTGTPVQRDGRAAGGRRGAQVAAMGWMPTPPTSTTLYRLISAAKPVPSSRRLPPELAQLALQAVQTVYSDDYRATGDDAGKWCTWSWCEEQQGGFGISDNVTTTANQTTTLLSAKLIATNGTFTTSTGRRAVFVRALVRQ